MAYRELTQHFPRPGWVEHDPIEIWQAMRTTLAEVGARLAESGETSPPWASPTSARPWSPSTAPAGNPCTGPSCGRTGARPPCAPSSPRRDTCRSCAPDRAGPRSLLQRHQGGLAPHRASSSWPPTIPGLSFCTVDTWVLWNLTGGPDGGAYATDPSNASRTLLLDTERRPGRPSCATSSACPPPTLPRWTLGGPLRHRRPSRPRPGRRRARRRSGRRACWATSRRHCSVRCCFEPGMVKVTYGTGSFALANAGPERPPRRRD